MRISRQNEYTAIAAGCQPAAAAPGRAAQGDLCDVSSTSFDFWQRRVPALVAAAKLSLGAAPHHGVDSSQAGVFCCRDFTPFVQCRGRKLVCWTSGKFQLLQANEFRITLLVHRLCLILAMLFRLLASPSQLSGQLDPSLTSCTHAPPQHPWRFAAVAPAHVTRSMP